MSNTYKKYRKLLSKCVRETIDNNASLLEDKKVSILSEEISEKIFKEKEFKLYRYVSINSYFDLENIYLTSRGSQNDAFEGISDLWDEDVETNYDEIDDWFYIKSFSENYSSPLMWGYYADGCKGVCIEYDLTLLPPDEKEIVKHLFPMHYTKTKQLLVNIESIRDHIRGNIPDGIYDSIGAAIQKSYEWKNELEWRIIEYNPLYVDTTIGELNSETNVIKVPFTCVNAVYIGKRVKDYSKILRHIKDYEKKHGTSVDIFYMKKLTDDFKFKFETER